ncbi:MAG: hypothetical protein C5B54_06385 [Acidobacteria bacterium]|nr:MAG: hypothetical protein C5B54_06385 [Acidobacteriota bacterium]
MEKFMKKGLLLLLMILATALYADNKYDKWLNEEVKPLITKEERDAFKKLKTDADRDKFITDFWARRDPSPDTPNNEFKDEYEKRLEFVNKQIKVPNISPIDSDMGLAFLLLGQPTEQKKEGEEKEGSPAPKMTWIYKTLPQQIASGETQVVFKADEDYGGYKFADKKTNDLLDKARTFYSQLSKMGADMKTKAAQALEPPISTGPLKSALDAAVSGTAPKDVTFDSLVEPYMTSEGQDYIAVALGLSGDAANSHVGIRLMDSKGAVLKELEYPFQREDENPGYFQHALKADPGDYTVAVAVNSGDKVGAMKYSVTIPDYQGKFSMSPLIIAKQYKQLTVGKPEPEPYTFQNYKLQPNFTRTYSQSDQLILFYEIYDLPLDSAGKANVDELLIIQKPGGPAHQNPPAPPQGLVVGKKMTVPSVFPLTSYDAGEYKITVKLTNKVTNETVTKEGSFTIK